MGYTKEDIKLAFESDAKDFTTFITELDSIKAEERARKKAEKEAKELEEANKFHFDSDYSAMELVDSYLSNERQVEKFLSNGNYEYTEDYEIPDGGIDYQRVIKIDDDFYLVDINSGSEWCGDWSARCNLAGRPTVNKLWLITKYELKDYDFKIIDKVESDLLK